MDFKTPTVKGVASDKVQTTVESYLNLHDDETEGDRKDQRTGSYKKLVNQYYNLVTDFYEWGWGQSFHFTIQHNSESFASAIARHEHQLALRMGLKKGMRVLDVGCGVGGPARNIAYFAGCQVVGLNNNKYQIERGTALNEKHGLSNLVSFVKGDFMHQPFEDNTFDGVYQIEATAHAPNKVECYKEIFRVLKPGQYFGGFEWCLTDRYDPEDPEHRRIKKGIEEGDGLPDIATCDEVVAALKEAGFEIEECTDLATETKIDYELPWYHYLTPSYLSPTRFQFTDVGRWITQKLLNSMETIHAVPQGTADVNNFLLTAADCLAAGGEKGIFTAVFFHLARKPLSSSSSSSSSASDE